MNPTWTRSTYCANGSCVDAAYDDERILVRDAAGTTIELRPDVWETVLTHVAEGRTPANAHSYPGGRVEWTGMPPHRGTEPVTLRYDAAEWAAFAAGVRGGEFAVETLAGAGTR